MRAACECARHVQTACAAGEVVPVQPTSASELLITRTPIPARLLDSRTRHGTEMQRRGTEMAKEAVHGRHAFLSTARLEDEGEVERMSEEEIHATRTYKAAGSRNGPHSSGLDAHPPPYPSTGAVRGASMYTERTGAGCPGHGTGENGRHAQEQGTSHLYRQYASSGVSRTDGHAHPTRREWDAAIDDAWGRIFREGEEQHINYQPSTGGCEKPRRLKEASAVTAHKALGGGLRISKALVKGKALAKGASKALADFFPRIQAPQQSDRAIAFCQSIGLERARSRGLRASYKPAIQFPQPLTAWPSFHVPGTELTPNWDGSGPAHAKKSISMAPSSGRASSSSSASACTKISFSSMTRADGLRKNSKEDSTGGMMKGTIQWDSCSGNVAGCAVKKRTLDAIVDAEEKMAELRPKIVKALTKALLRPWSFKALGLGRSLGQRKAEHVDRKRSRVACGRGCPPRAPKLKPVAQVD
ncbi:hypothetical protein C8R44DRAFT_752972 [Mycena epipterygia]|nr:hypothetical protein C8R44DRAFT_752972 [Mycena epipterygia]